MKHRVYLVRGQDGSCFGWLVKPPLAGCHARGEDCESVIEALPRQIEDFLAVLENWSTAFQPDEYLAGKIEVAAELKRRGSASDGSSHLFPEERSAPSRTELSERLHSQATPCYRDTASKRRLGLAGAGKSRDAHGAGPTQARGRR